MASYWREGQQKYMVTCNCFQQSEKDGGLRKFGHMCRIFENEWKAVEKESPASALPFD